MVEPQLLSLEEAAARAGVRKRDVRRLVIDGRLPAVRADGRWRIAAPDLDRLLAKTTSETSIAHPEVAEPAPGARPVSELSVLIDMLRDRDRQLGELQDERAQLSSQIGFLLGRLSEREEHIHSLEQALLAAGTAIQETVETAAAITPLGDGRISLPMHLPALAAPDSPEMQLTGESATTLESTPQLPPASDRLPNPDGATPRFPADAPLRSPVKKRNWLAVLIWGSPDP
ncbi:MAG TPA: helix-turn-helix domain-containing protein [Chloroflexota bacterium]|jgi:excisionase family DNA binding protein